MFSLGREPQDQNDKKNQQAPEGATDFLVSVYPTGSLRLITWQPLED